MNSCQIKRKDAYARSSTYPRHNIIFSNYFPKKNGIPHEYILFSDEGHGFARPENRMAFNAAAEEFLAKYLGGRYEPPSAAEKKLLDSFPIHSLRLRAYPATLRSDSPRSDRFTNVPITPQTLQDRSTASANPGSLRRGYISTLAEFSEQIE